MKLWSGRISVRRLVTILIVICPGAISALAQEAESAKMAWTIQSSGVIARLSSVFFVDPQRGWIAGSNGTLLFTENGGLKWRKVTIPDRQKKELFRDIWFFSTGRGCLLGEYSLPNRNKLLEKGRVFLLLNDSQDAEWMEGQPARPSAKMEGDDSEKSDGTTRSSDPLLLRLNFVNDQVGWLCGESGMIQVTDDGGETWQIQSSPTLKLLYDIMGVSEKQAWAVGAAGMILHTGDGGRRWREQASGVTDGLRGVHFVDAKHGWAVGTTGIIISTDDGGEHWQKQTSGTTQTLNDLFFVSPKEGWIAGDRGLMLHTLDGGGTWDEFPIATNTSLTRLFFLAPDRGWVVGANGAVFRYGASE